MPCCLHDGMSTLLTICAQCQHSVWSMVWWGQLSLFGVGENQWYPKNHRAAQRERGAKQMSLLCKECHNCWKGKVSESAVSIIQISLMPGVLCRARVCKLVVKRCFIHRCVIKLCTAVLFWGTFNGRGRLSLLTSSSPPFQGPPSWGLWGIQWRCQKGASVTNGDHGEVRWVGCSCRLNESCTNNFMSTFPCVCVRVHVYLQGLRSNLKRWGLNSLAFELILLIWLHCCPSWGGLGKLCNSFTRHGNLNVGVGEKQF